MTTPKENWRILPYQGSLQLMEKQHSFHVLIIVLLCVVGSSWTQHNRTACVRDENCSEYNNVGVCDNNGTCEYNNVGVCVNNGTCECNSTIPEGCFEVDNSSNLCVLTRCAVFRNDSKYCQIGTKSRTTALLLSIFLINFGAANFYIERYAFAVPQILLGLLVCVFQFGACGAACSRSDHDETSIPCIVCCSCNAFLSFTIFAWWLADLVIFALNDRSDGNGCPLYT